MVHRAARQGENEPAPAGAEATFVEAAYADVTSVEAAFVVEELSFPRHVVLRRLGYPRGAEPPGRVVRELDRVEAMARELARPLVVYREAAIRRSPGVVVLDELEIRCAKTASILRNADSAVVFVVTLGSPYDERINELQRAGDMFTVFLLEGFAVTGVYQLLKAFRTRVKVRGLHLTRHYSPGYEGWPLVDNAKVFEFLRASRYGFELTPGYSLTPTKSLTGVFGAIRS